MNADRFMAILAGWIILPLMVLTLAGGLLVCLGGLVQLAVYGRTIPIAEWFR